MYSPGLEKRIDNFAEAKNFQLNLPTSCVLDFGLHLVSLVVHVVLFIQTKTVMFLFTGAFCIFVGAYCMYSYTIAKSDINPSSKGYAIIREYAFLRILIITGLLTYGTAVLVRTWMIHNEASSEEASSSSDMMAETASNVPRGVCVGGWYLLQGLVMWWSNRGFVAGLSYLKRRIIGEPQFVR